MSTARVTPPKSELDITLGRSLLAIKAVISFILGSILCFQPETVKRFANNTKNDNYIAECVLTKVGTLLYGESAIAILSMLSDNMGVSLLLFGARHGLSALAVYDISATRSVRNRTPRNTVRD